MPPHLSGPACLLALPAALSLGGPALAQSVIAVNHTTGINLASYGPAVSITSGASITSAGWAGVWDAAPVSLANAGSTSAANGEGIYLGGGGAVTNTGFISGDNAVWLAAGGSLNNAGVISATDYGVRASAPASVTNSGAITARFDGISLDDGGSVTNTGSIFGGHIGVYTGGAVGGGAVLNEGTISSRDGTGVSLYMGGTLTNTASGDILGGYNGAYEGGSGSRIVNAGLISGPHSGVFLTGAAELSNTGTINGGINGVISMGRGGTVLNEGVITGGHIGVRMQPGGYVQNSGTITGLTGVEMQSGTFLDTGTITGTGGTAISFVGGASTLTLGSGAEIDGVIAGNGTASQISLTGTGTLTDDITGLNAGGALTIAPGADWTASGTWTVASVVNAGIFTPGDVAAPLTINGNFTQLSTGTLRILVTPTAVTQLTVNGTARLAGALVYVLAPGSYTPGSETFLRAMGGVNGAFATVTSQLPGTGQVQIEGAALSPPRLVFASRFTVAPQDTALYPALAQALGQEGLAGAQALLAHDSGCTAPAPGVGEAAQMASALASGFCAAGGWVQGGGDAVTAGGAYHDDGGGVLAGLDRPVATGGRLGLAVGYESSALKDAAGGKGGFEALRLGLYATQQVGALALSASLLDGIGTQTSTRATGDGDATGKTNANVLSGVVQAALPLVYAGTTITPAAGLRIAHVSLGRLSETAAAQAFALTAGGSAYTVAEPYLRVSLARSLTLANGWVFAPAVSLGVSGNTGFGADMPLTAADGTVFTATPRHLSPLAGEAGLGFSLGDGAWRIHAAYSATPAGNFSAQSLQAGVLIRF